MAKEKQWEVYIIQTKCGKLYTGISNDLEKRFQAHSKHQKGARFFYFSDPEKILYRESFPNRSEATKREIFIKKLSRENKIKLINSINNCY